MGGTDAGDYKRLCPCGPVFHHGLVAEVSMKLIENHALARGLRRNVLRVDIGVLPGPAYFDHVLFCMEAYPKRNTIARARVEHDTRVRPCDMGINRETHARAITHERSEFETHWFCLRLLLCAEGRRKHDDEYRRDDDDCFLRQCISD